MGLMLALGSFSFWQDQLPHFWGNAELHQLLPWIFSALFPGLPLYPVFSEENKLLLIQSCQILFFFSNTGILEKSSQGTKLFEFSKACSPTQVKPQLDLPK